MSEAEFLVIGILLLSVVLIFLAGRRIHAGQTYALRPLSSYETIRQQMGIAVESGRRPHFTLGRGPLHTRAGLASVAALNILRYLGDISSKSDLTPLVTVGEGTLLPAAQGNIGRAFDAADRGSAFRLTDVEFLADNSFPFTYAAGATYAISRADTGNNAVIGRFDEEIAIITEAGYRADMGQVTGSDNPVAIALATAATPTTLWGEELFVAGAYLQRSPLQLASVRAQDVLRYLLVAAILIIAVLHLLYLV